MESGNKERLHTHYNFLFLHADSTYGLNSKRGYEYGANFGSCGENIKLAQSGYVFIPVEWMDYFGETEESLKEWIAFINRNEINVKTEYVGRGEMSSFVPKPSDVCASDWIIKKRTSYSCYIVDTGRSLYDNDYTELTRNDFYVVKLERENANDIGKFIYLSFILLRYIYNDHYRPIIDNIRKILKETELNEWQAILLATGLNNYSGDFNFSSSGFTPNIFLPKEFYIDRMKKTPRMTESFKGIAVDKGWHTEWKPLYSKQFPRTTSIPERIEALQKQYNEFDKTVLEYDN